MVAEYAVLCGGGAQGGAVVRALCGRGARVRVLGRGAARVRDAFGDGVAFVAADLDQPSSVATALEGCAGVFAMLPLPPDLATAQARAGGLLDALASARPPRVVYSTGGYAMAALAASGYVQANLGMVAALQALALPLLVLKPAVYLDNLAWTDLTARLRGEGVLDYPPLPTGRRLSWTTHADQGEAAATALLAPAFPTGCFDIIAHGAPTMADLAAALSRIIGRPVAHREVTPAAFGEALGVALGSAEMGAAIGQMYAAIAAAPQDAVVLDAGPLERALGIRMHSVEQWLQQSFR
jgi:NAD(P)H dehydrogenase (quinone)